MTSFFYLHYKLLRLFVLISRYPIAGPPAASTSTTCGDAGCAAAAAAASGGSTSTSVSSSGTQRGTDRYITGKDKDKRKEGT